MIWPAKLRVLTERAASGTANVVFTVRCSIATASTPVPGLSNSIAAPRRGLSWPPTRPRYPITNRRLARPESASPPSAIYTLLPWLACVDRRRCSLGNLTEDRTLRFGLCLGRVPRRTLPARQFRVCLWREFGCHVSRYPGGGVPRFCRPCISNEMNLALSQLDIGRPSSSQSHLHPHHIRDVCRVVSFPQLASLCVHSAHTCGESVRLEDDG